VIGATVGRSARNGTASATAARFDYVTGVEGAAVGEHNARTFRVGDIESGTLREPCVLLINTDALSDNVDEAPSSASPSESAPDRRDVC
jgi:hypothetical protein